MNGTWRDKMHTLTSLSVFAAQHHMHWVNLGLGAGWNSSSVSEETSTGPASGWAPARRPMSTPTRIRCILPMSGRAIISAGEWRR
jgi:hypothetical protein